MQMIKPDLAQLKFTLRYLPEYGVFVWNDHDHRNAGQVAGFMSQGRVLLWVNFMLYPQYLIREYYLTGEWYQDDGEEPQREKGPVWFDYPTRLWIVEHRGAVIGSFDALADAQECYANRNKGLIDD